jgi:eukaryotic-like serine/threonine-protein kinase
MRTPKSERDRAFRQVTKKFEKIVSLSSKQLQEVLDSTAPEVKKLAGLLNIPSSSFVQEMVSTIGFRDGKTGSESPPSQRGADDAGSKEFVSDVSPDQSAATDDAPYSGDQESIIINGIQEITNTLAEDYTFNDLIAMIVEIVYRGFAFDRAMFCMTSPKQPRITARFGLGNDIKRFLGTFGFRVSKNMTDVFNTAVTQNLDFRIDDANAGPIRSRIPDWYRKTVNAPSFIIYPIFIDNVCLGFLYADRAEEGEPIPNNQLNYMRTLRNQLVIGIKQKRMRR